MELLSNINNEVISSIQSKFKIKKMKLTGPIQADPCASGLHNPLTYTNKNVAIHK